LSAVRILFTITLFVSSALLFLVQPMIAKMILPRFGGSPGVWNAAMLFFQGALLLGYGYAHVATKWLGPKVQAGFHILVLLLPLAVLPIGLPADIAPSGSESPGPLVLYLLAVSVGLPFLVVSAGAPLLQRWFAATGDEHAKDPYFLYSASNLGSLLALLAYPAYFEARFTLGEQTRIWMFGYIVLVGLMGCCAVALWAAHRKPVEIHEAPVELPPEDAGAETEVDWKLRLRWIALAFCPSSILLGVTTFLTSNVTPMPLLWVVPLALYLVTFIVAFAKRRALSPALLSRITPIVLVPLGMMIILEASQPSLMIPLAIFHLFVFFIVALLCHSLLADARPGAQRLTEFYFFVSLGGVLGGLFNAIVAPSLFNGYYEYPIVLAAACLFRLAKDRSIRRSDHLYVLGVIVISTVAVLFAKAIIPQPTQIRTAMAIGVPLVCVFLGSDRPYRFAASFLGVYATMMVLQIAMAGRIVEAKRSFFGLHRVERFSFNGEEYYNLIHGNTVHGRESLRRRGVPLTYYHHDGPIGRFLESVGLRFRREALVGLGVGSLAAYGKPGQQITFYEIDPDVVEIARDSGLFSFVRNSKAQVQFEIGDARLRLTRAPDFAYDLILLDAFSSDSIPVHLITKEALALYTRKLAPHGFIAFHISNRYLDLEPVLAEQAKAAGLLARVNEDIYTSADGKFASTWVIMFRSKEDLGPLMKDAAWSPLEEEEGFPLWTDDYSNILGALRAFRHAN
jgi:hypothetical protein